jgi:hypothetical protein
MASLRGQLFRAEAEVSFSSPALPPPSMFVKAFTPDFYLPDLDLFIELTTMKQSLVTKKNRKVRLLREHYPDVNIKILYERDYKNLIWKYGLGQEEEANGNGDAA